MDTHSCLCRIYAFNSIIFLIVLISRQRLTYGVCLTNQSKRLKPHQHLWYEEQLHYLTNVFRFVVFRSVKPEFQAFVEEKQLKIRPSFNYNF